MIELHLMIQKYAEVKNSDRWVLKNTELIVSIQTIKTSLKCIDRNKNSKNKYLPPLPAANAVKNK